MDVNDGLNAWGKPATSSGMKIALVIPVLGPGGAALVARNLALGLAARGHQVLVCAVRRFADRAIVEAHYGRLFSTEGVTIVEGVDLRVRSPRALLRAGCFLRDAIARFEPDVIHSHCELPDLLVSLFTRGIHVPKVRSSHIDPYFNNFLPPLLGRFAEHALNAFGGWSRVVAISEQTRRLNSRSAPTVLIYNGLVDQAHPPVRTRHAPDGVLRAAIVARYERRKGQLGFLKHWQKCEPGPGARPFVVSLYGEGRDRAEIEKLARSLGEKVIIAGWVSDQDSIYCGIDVLLIPSIAEGLSSVMVEALARGIPVLSFSVSGTADIFGGHDHDAVVSSFGEMLARLDAHRLPTVADDFVGDLRQKFSIMTFCDRHCALYRELIGSRQKAAGGIEYPLAGHEAAAVKVR